MLKKCEIRFYSMIEDINLKYEFIQLKVIFNYGIIGAKFVNQIGKKTILTGVPIKNQNNVKTQDFLKIIDSTKIIEIFEGTNKELLEKIEFYENKIKENLEKNKDEIILLKQELKNKFEDVKVIQRKITALSNSI